MASKYPHFRNPPAGVYRVIEIDTRKQTTISGEHERDEATYTTVIGDFSDWDDAVSILGRLTNKRCRRSMWSSRGCVGENNYGEIRAYDPFR